MSLDRRQTPRERRRTARAPLTAAVAKRVGDRTHLAQASNIGPLGMTLRYVGDASVYPPHAPLMLTFQLPDRSDVIEVRARVVFDRPEGAYRTAGVRFDEIAPDDASRIARFVDAAD